jgi:hypothetical protein
MGTSSHPAAGFVIVAFSGMMTASFAAPMKLSRRWAWENLWLVYATLALVLIPTPTRCSICSAGRNGSPV